MSSMNSFAFAIKNLAKYLRTNGFQVFDQQNKIHYVKLLNAMNQGKLNNNKEFIKLMKKVIKFSNKPLCKLDGWEQTLVRVVYGGNDSAYNADKDFVPSEQSPPAPKEEVPVPPSQPSPSNVRQRIEGFLQFCQLDGEDLWGAFASAFNAELAPYFLSQVKNEEIPPQSPPEDKDDKNDGDDKLVG